VIGLIFYLYLDAFEQGTRFSLFQLFYGLWFWILLFVLVPLITMRQFSDEYRSGTVELLLTAPVTEWDVVLSKYLSALFFFMLFWLPTGFYQLVFQIVTGDQIPIDISSFLLSFLIISLLGSFYISIGVFTSSLTRHQAVAALLSFFIIMILFITSMLSGLVYNMGIYPLVEYTNNIQHLQLFLRGVFDTRPLVFLLSGTVFFLFLTNRVMAAKKLKS